MPPMLFARLQADVDLKIRRGAWYRVLDLGDLEAVIERAKEVGLERALVILEAGNQQEATSEFGEAGGRSRHLVAGNTHLLERGGEAGPAPLERGRVIGPHRFGQ